jgi:hypothetical protein
MLKVIEVQEERWMNVEESKCRRKREKPEEH